MNLFAISTRSVLVSLMIFFLTGSLLASDKFTMQTYTSYAHRDFSAWPTLIERQQQIAFSDSGSYEDIVNTFVDYYGYIGHLMDFNQKKDAAKWLKKAKTAFEPVRELYSDRSQTWALHAMFLSYEIALSPFKATYVSKSLLDAVKHAQKLSSSDPLAKLAQANILFYFPGAFGGDKKEALKLYKSIYDYYQQRPELAESDWVYLNIMSTISFAYEKLGNYPQAIAWAEKALEVAPDFSFVKDQLLPRLQKRGR